MTNCCYCNVPADEAWISTDLAMALPHPEPVTACHMVVIPRRHVAAFYDLDVQEQRVVWELVTEIRKRISTGLIVKGFEVGFVDGPRNGENHAHVQVIPRTDGDGVVLPDGVEWVRDEL